MPFGDPRCPNCKMPAHIGPCGRPTLSKPWLPPPNTTPLPPDVQQAMHDKDAILALQALICVIVSRFYGAEPRVLTFPQAELEAAMERVRKDGPFVVERDEWNSDYRITIPGKGIILPDTRPKEPAPPKVPKVNTKRARKRRQIAEELWPDVPRTQTPASAESSSTGTKINTPPVGFQCKRHPLCHLPVNHHGNCSILDVHKRGTCRDDMACVLNQGHPGRHMDDSGWLL